MDALLSGFADALTLTTLWYVALGVFLGLAVGAVPGLSAPMAIALGVPLTYSMAPVTAIGFLVGINKGGFYGGALSAIMLNTPGSAEAAATAYDGYPLARQGKGMKAIKMSLYASVFGDIFSTVLLIVVAAPIAGLALRMGPSEVCGLILFSLTLIAALESRSLAKGLAAAAVGMLFSTVGMDPVVGEPRLTLGLFQLESGVRLVGLAIGLLALSELIVQTEDADLGADASAAAVTFSSRPEDNRVSWAEFKASLWTMVRSSGIGAVIGALPGLGATVAGFLAYGAARTASKNPESYGKGSLDGVAAPESANNAVIGAALIPLFTLGIPGNVAAALLIGAFILHGVTPGPLMFEQHSDMVYGIYAAMLMGNVLLLGIGYAGIRFFTKVLRTPKIVLYPVIIYICLVGAYLEEPSVFSVGLMVGFAMLGYFMKKLQFSFVCFIVGFILGPMLELSFQQTVISYGGNYGELLTRPVTVGLGALIIVFLLWKFVFFHRRSA